MAKHAALAIYAGNNAAKQLSETGWQADRFSLLMGASGGPKMFALSQLDRVLFPFLKNRNAPLSALGSSIGAWRHACLAQDDPVAAMNRLEQGYLHQSYDTDKPSVTQISEFSRALLEETLSTQGTEQIIGHPQIKSHIVTARGRGPNSAQGSAPRIAGMGSAALGNSIDRRILGKLFQRVVFYSGDKPGDKLPLEGFDNHFVPLTPDNLKHALHATASIPFLLEGDKDIPGAPLGHYWDGGIIDYHFDPAYNAGDTGLILYPHFGTDIITGWFDKMLPWRRNTKTPLDQLVVLCPSKDFIASLPGGKIPDRRDFTRLDTDTRMRHWIETIKRCEQMAEEFAKVLSSDDPLRYVQVLPQGARRLSADAPAKPTHAL